MNKKVDDDIFKDGFKLPIMESFYTIQGEGFYKGSAAFFIRVAGCDVGCHWCDVKESWDSDLYPLFSVQEILKKAKNHSRMIVVTGGEPLMWNMYPLTELLKKNKFIVHIETSGSNKLTGVWDWICLSPKRRKNPLDEIYVKANELKIIVFNRHDFKYAEEQAKKVSKNCILYLQPEWEKREKIIPLIIDYVMKNNKWKISLQTHKYLNIP
tara:strand:- start:102 stop:734 length:633 start_codon:yes stop_codon:yes gene_type:complete